MMLSCGTTLDENIVLVVGFFDYEYADDSQEGTPNLLHQQIQDCLLNMEPIFRFVVHDGLR